MYFRLLPMYLFSEPHPAATHYISDPAASEDTESPDLSYPSGSLGESLQDAASHTDGLLFFVVRF